MADLKLTAGHLTFTATNHLALCPSSGVPCGGCSGDTPAQIAIQFQGGLVDGPLPCSSLNGNTFILNQRLGDPCTWELLLPNGICITATTAGTPGVLIVDVSDATCVNHGSWASFAMPADCMTWAAETIAFQSAAYASACDLTLPALDCLATAL